MVPNQLLAVSYKIEPFGINPGTESAATAENLVSKIFGVLTIIAFIFFAFQVIFAGIALIASEGDKNKAETARKRLTDGILGLTIVVVAVALGSLLATLLGIPDVFNLVKSLPKF